MEIRIEAREKNSDRDFGGKKVFEALARQVSALDWASQIDLAKTLDGHQPWTELAEDQKRIFRMIWNELS